MKRRSALQSTQRASTGWIAALLLLFFPNVLRAATVGTVVPILGQPSSLAYDAARKLLFIANTTENRIEVYSQEQRQLLEPIAVGRRPVGIALVPERNLLLVCNTTESFLTIIDLATLRASGTISVTPRSLTPETPFSIAPLSAATALLSTNVGLQLVDIAARTTRALTPSGFTPAANSGLVLSGDRKMVLGQASGVAFLYDATTQAFVQTRAVNSSTLLAADQTGSRFLVGGAEFDNQLSQVAQIFSAGQALSLGGVAFSADSSKVYVGTSQQAAQVQVRAASTLKLLSTFRAPEAITGSILASPSGDALFAVSQSGIIVVDLTALASLPSLAINKRLLYFSAALCGPASASATVQISNLGAGDFTWSATTTASNVVSLQPTSGTGPAELQVTVNPASFSFRGTAAVATVRISSDESVNGDQLITLFLNLRSPDQVGTVFPVSGSLSDLLVDDIRQRVYLVNSSENQLEVFSLSEQNFLPAVPVGSIPKGIAFSPNKTQLLVTNLGAEYVSVLDAETLVETSQIRIPHPTNPRGTQPGTFPFSIAGTSGGTVLLQAAPVGAAASGTIYRLRPPSATVTAFPDLGGTSNAVSGITFLATSGNGAFLFAAESRGTLHLYNAFTGNFPLARSLTNTTITGNVAASVDGSWYHLGNLILNSVLVPQGSIASEITAIPSSVAGFAFTANGAEAYRGIRPAFFTNGLPTPTAPRIEKVDAGALKVVSGFNIAEALAPNSSAAQLTIFRQLVLNGSETAMYGITESGFIVIPLAGAVSTSAPQVNAGGVVNAASFALAPAPVAPGSIAAIFGLNLAQNAADAIALPLPKILGEACVTFDGFVAPFFHAEPLQLYVQVPWELAGRSTASVVVSREGAASPPVAVNLASTAPGLFTFSGDGQGPGAVRHNADFAAVTVSNPARIGEVIAIFATGLGPTNPAIGTGLAAPVGGPLSRTNTPGVTIGGLNASVVFSGLAPGNAGVYQINVQVPSNAPVGTSVPVVVRMGTQTSNTATIAVVPVNP